MYKARIRYLGQISQCHVNIYWVKLFFSEKFKFMRSLPFENIMQEQNVLVI